MIRRSDLIILCYRSADGAQLSFQRIGDNDPDASAVQAPRQR